MSERPVGDVDIVVFGPHDAEDIKAYIVVSHDRFSLDPSKDPGATHQILYFNLHWGLGLRCKVDILTSGRNSALQIPSIPRRYVTYLGANDDIPVVPLLVLLILKVQGWRDNSAKKKKAKILRDIRDVDTLLDMMDEDDQLYHYRWLPKWFFENAEQLITRYTIEFPGTAYLFRDLGFDV